MKAEELKEAEDKVKDLAEKLSREEQAVLYLFLYRLGHRIHDSQLFVSDILRRYGRT